MERERQPRIRTSERLRALGHLVFDRYPVREYKPSAQRDVGKAASKAANVQLVIEGMNQRYTQPEGSFGYTDRPDSA